MGHKAKMWIKDSRIRERGSTIWQKPHLGSASGSKALILLFSGRILFLNLKQNSRKLLCSEWIFQVTEILRKFSSDGTGRSIRLKKVVTVRDSAKEKLELYVKSKIFLYFFEPFPLDNQSKMFFFWSSNTGSAFFNRSLACRMHVRSLIQAMYCRGRPSRWNSSWDLKMLLIKQSMYRIDRIFCRCAK
jgi:hypothetical protein